MSSNLINREPEKSTRVRALVLYTDDPISIPSITYGPQAWLGIVYKLRTRSKSWVLLADAQSKTKQLYVKMEMLDKSIANASIMTWSLFCLYHHWLTKIKRQIISFGHLFSHSKKGTNFYWEFIYSLILSCYFKLTRILRSSPFPPSTQMPFFSQAL